MNQTVTLVTGWANFEAAHPGATLEDFCRYYLTTQKSKEDPGPNFVGSGIPPGPRSFLMKLLGFIVRASQVYFEKAFDQFPEIRQKEDFFFLNAIAHRVESRKTDIIQDQLCGFTTGMDTLSRLLSNGLIVERPDPEDKRAKLIQLTPKGKEVLYRGYAAADKVSDLLFHKMSEEDILLCIQLLRGTEAWHSRKLLEIKDKSMEDLYNEWIGAVPDSPVLAP
jgi:DNA-binding MarR family transcriptional regulator